MQSQMWARRAAGATREQDEVGVLLCVAAPHPPKVAGRTGAPLWLLTWGCGTPVPSFALSLMGARCGAAHVQDTATEQEVWDAFSFLY